MAENSFPVGRIVGAHGIKGLVKIEPLTDYPEDRMKAGSRLRLKNDWVTVESYAVHKGRPLLKLAGIDDMSAAQALQWETLEYVGDDRPELEEDEFFIEDLIGLRVVTSDGKELGEVEDVLEMPAHDVLQIGDVLVPMVKEFVKDIDFDTETITVELIPGMLPGEETA